MKTRFFAFDARHPLAERATHLLAHLVERPALSRGPSHPNTPQARPAEESRELLMTS